MRVLFDKLEDQNLHLSSQLAAHQAQLQAFYGRVSTQNDQLRSLLSSVDVNGGSARDTPDLGGGSARDAAGGDGVPAGAKAREASRMLLGGLGGAGQYKFIGELLQG